MCDPGEPCMITVTRPIPPPVPDPEFKIEAVIVCDQFSDFLTRTLPTNKQLFNQVVVVTSPEDKVTQRICEFNHVRCIKTDALQSRWDEFHKGKGINEGLEVLDKDGWVVHMDADIYLPPQTRMLLKQAHLDPCMVYGIDRFEVKGYQEWDAFTALPPLQHECGTYIHLKSFPLGTRIMFDHTDGWLPLGFFQMWNPRVSGVSVYPSNHTTAGRSDTLFSMQWPRSMRGLIPEVIAYHLDPADKEAMDTNWSGRVSKSFSHTPKDWNKLP